MKLAKQLFLAVHRMMEAQIVGGLCNLSIERSIAGEANVSSGASSRA